MVLWFGFVLFFGLCSALGFCGGRYGGPKFDG